MENSKPVYDFDELTKVMRKWASGTNEKRYVCTFEEANDGSGDGILNFPDEMCSELGWEVGDTIEIDVDENNHIFLTKKS